MEQDVMWRQQVSDSSVVIKSHASFIGTAATEIKSMPTAYVPACLAELDEAESVLRRALAKIEQAKRDLAAKPKMKNAA